MHDDPDDLEDQEEPPRPKGADEFSPAMLELFGGSAELAALADEDANELLRFVESSMTEDEAARLLMLTAFGSNDDNGDSDMPAEATPPVIAEVARECGLLPLTLTIAGRIINEYGEGWEGSIMKLIANQHSNRTEKLGLPRAIGSAAPGQRK